MGTRRIGHTGTLDPFATGLLVLLVGQATRLAQFVDGEPKVYEATIAFGAETDTDDLTGAVTRNAEPPAPEAIDREILGLTGAIQQIPPDYSARQSGGVRAYDAARRGTPLELKPTSVTVHRWTVLARDDATITVRIECSGGTYIRALARDLGRLVGSAAHLTVLRRISSGRFTVGDACTVERLRAREFKVLDMREAIASLPAQPLSDADAGRVSHGNPVAAAVDGDRVALVAGNGKLAAIANRSGELLQPVAVFAHA